ncbi:MAG TPA: DUF1573 domain-containing protein [Candidatus Aminicenantes bacterium]|nr:DUF1573 domain-containing protein [Candidatus Aminicenantes bacterium]
MIKIESGANRDIKRGEKEMTGKKSSWLKKLSLIALVLAWGGLSSPALAAKKGPRLFLQEKSYDFGEVQEGKVVTHVFIFKNIGDETLVINRVRTTCGCTAALLSQKQLQPGEQGKVEVKFNTRGYEGRLSRYLYLESNDPQNPKAQITIKATIKVPPRPRIDVNRFSFDLGLFLQEEPLSFPVKIRNRGEKVLEVTVNHKEATVWLNTAQITTLTLKPKQEKEIIIKLPPRQRPGLIREYIILRSNDPIRRNLSLYVSGYALTRKQLQQLFQKYKNIIKMNQ